MNDNYTCKGNSSSHDAEDEDVAYVMPNPWIQWAKLGARVQRYYETLRYFKDNHGSISIVIEELLENYEELFADVINKSNTPDDKS